jgi:hypothetical protein
MSEANTNKSCDKKTATEKVKESKKEIDQTHPDIIELKNKYPKNGFGDGFIS